LQKKVSESGVQYDVEVTDDLNAALQPGKHSKMYGLEKDSGKFLISVEEMSYGEHTIDVNPL